MLLNCDIPSQIEETKAVIDEMCDISSNVISLVACRMHKVLVKITQYFSKNPSLTSQQEKGLQMQQIFLQLTEQNFSQIL